MKRTNLAKKLTAMAMTGAMVMSMGMTAFAAGPLTVTEDKVTLTKEITKGEDVLYPNTTFSFAVSPFGTPNMAIEGETDPVVYGGVAGGASFAEGDDTITVTPESTDLTTEITLNSSVFTKPGVFRYVVTETAGDYDGMAYDTDYYYLDLYVVNGEEGYDFDAVVASQVTEEGVVSSEKSDLTFTNVYTTNDLTVTKIITGNQANMNEKFSFEITVNGATGEKYDTSVEDIVLESGKAATVELGNNESIIIYGLSAKDTFTVVEKDANTDGYTTTYTLDDADVQADGLVDVAEGTADKVVEVTNDKTVTTPTGIAMTFAPYIVMVAFAGVFAVMFLRKKREDF